MVAVGYQDPVAEIVGDLQAVVGSDLDDSAPGKPAGKLPGCRSRNAKCSRNFRSGDFALSQYDLQCPINAIFVHKAYLSDEKFSADGALRLKWFR